MRLETTTRDKTCWDKSWKSSKFKEWVNFLNSKSPPYPLDQYWIWPSFVVKIPKPWEQYWSEVRGVFSLRNRFYILPQQFCPRLWVINIFLKTCPKLLNGIEMHVGAMYALTQSIPSYKNYFYKLMLVFSIKIWHFCRLPSIYQKKQKKSSLFSLKLTQMSVWHQKRFQHAVDIKIKKIQVLNIVSI